MHAVSLNCLLPVLMQELQIIAIINNSEYLWGMSSVPGTAGCSICSTLLEARNTVNPLFRRKPQVSETSLLLGWLAPDLEDFIALGS